MFFSSSSLFHGQFEYERNFGQCFNKIVINFRLIINFPLKLFVCFCCLLFFFFSTLNSKITAVIFVKPNEIVKWMLFTLGRAIKIKKKLNGLRRRIGKDSIGWRWWWKFEDKLNGEEHAFLQKISQSVEICVVVVALSSFIHKIHIFKMKLIFCCCCGGDLIC